MSHEKISNRQKREPVATSRLSTRVSCRRRAWPEPSAFSPQSRSGSVPVFPVRWAGFQALPARDSRPTVGSSEAMTRDPSTKAVRVVVNPLSRAVIGLGRKGRKGTVINVGGYEQSLPNAYLPALRIPGSSSAPSGAAWKQWRWNKRRRRIWLGRLGLPLVARLER